MNEDEVYKKIAGDMKGVNDAVDTANNYLKALREAGEDVQEMQNQLRLLEKKKVKWENVLKNRGYKVEV